MTTDVYLCLTYQKIKTVKVKQMSLQMLLGLHMWIIPNGSKRKAFHRILRNGNLNYQSRMIHNILYYDCTRTHHGNKLVVLLSLQLQLI